MPRLPRFRLLLLPLLALALPRTPAHAAPGTWSVNVGGTGDFVSLQPAVDHAQPGDTILVWGPANGHQVLRRVTITKGLTIIGLAPERVRLDDLHVHDVPAGQAVTLVNLSVGEFTGSSWPPGYFDYVRAEGALVADCAGPVVFRGCSFTGGSGGPGGPGMRAVRSDVALLDCEIQGGMGGDAGTSITGFPNKQHALVLEDARAFVAGSLLHGGEGGYVEAFRDTAGGRGGDGVRASGASVLWLLDSTVLAGSGDTVLSVFGPMAIGGDGGIGVRLAPGSGGFSRAGTIEGGEGGSGDTADGDDGRDVVGDLTIRSGGALGLELPSWTRDVDATLATVRGEPGTSAFLLVGGTAGFRGAGAAGVLVADGATSIPLGPLPPSGETTVPIPLPALQPGDSQLLVIQSVLQEPGGLSYGEARALVVLDSRWLPAGFSRLHVDGSAPSGGDGRTWGTAFSELRQALEAAPGIGPGTTDVWVRGGVYRPVPAGHGPIEPFFVKSQTRVYGSFAGTETDLSQRDAALHPTVITGDLLGNDNASDASREDNSRLLVAVGPWEPRASVRLDGLTLLSGHNAPWGSYGPAFRGSAIDLRGSVDLVGCTFIDNRLASTVFAGEGSDLRVVGCRFLRNECRGPSGGFGACRAGWITTAGSALFADCEFAGNSSLYGGGIYTQVQTRIVSCTFYGNLGQWEGGAVLAAWSCPELVIENSLSWSNVSPESPDFGMTLPTVPIRVDYSLFQGGSTSPWGIGNVEGPPRLVDPDGADGVLGTIDDDLTPRTSSPAVDAGSNALLPADELDIDSDGDVLEPLPIDAAGMPRRADDPNVPDTGAGTPPIVDMGSRERHP